MKNAVHELVHVRNGHVLVDSAWRVRSYATRNGRPLEPGYYLTLRAGPSGEYDRRTRYYGPYESRRLAEQMATSASYLGLAEPAAPQTRPRILEDRRATGSRRRLHGTANATRDGQGDEAWRYDNC